MVQNRWTNGLHNPKSFLITLPPWRLKKIAKIMSNAAPMPFGSHLVFVDESGDHGLARMNLAYDILAKKFRRSSTGEIKGWGLKVFP